MGMQPGGLFEDDTGQKYYLKWEKDNKVRIEALAAGLYSAAGVPVPDVSIVTLDNGRLASKSKWIPEAEYMGMQELRENSDVRDNFVVDAWLSNWDVVNPGAENIVNVNGQGVRVDLGGTMIFRAQGQPRQYPRDVKDLETLVDPYINYEMAYVFENLTDDELRAGAEGVASVSDETIDDLVDRSGLPNGPIPEYPYTKNVAKFVKDRLKQRRDYIKDKILG